MSNARIMATCLLAGLACLALVAGQALAYDQYSDATNGAGRCANCHGEFRGPNYTSLADGVSWGNDDLHTPHASDMLSGDCDTCHNSLGIGRTVILGQSDGGFNFPAIACAGCHGREGDGTGTGAEGYGAGLRQHHWRSGITTCGSSGCHENDSNPAVFTPVGEDEPPPYYASAGAASHPDMPQDACNDTTNAISPEEDSVGGPNGLDNDGDLDYDTADTDCGAVASAPGETSGPILPLMEVTSYDPVAMLMSLSYGNPCDAADNAILYGPLSDVGVYNYTGNGGCSVGNTGTVTDWSYAGAPDSFFFLMVGESATAEGSYGTCKPFVVCDPVEGERPSDDMQSTPACPLAQDLPNRCD